MANKKISQLPSLTTLASGDEIAVVDVSGTPTTKRVTANNLMTLAPVQSVAGRTGTVTLSNTDISGLGSAATTASTDYATSAQGTTADSAQQPPSEGAFVDGDKTKLDGVEASADVTDTANVTSAGALMDSEVTNLAEVKAFDSSDYATSSQGTLAANALPKGGGAMTGAITTNSTFDGRGVATDGTKLDGIEASADVTDATNVTAAGALMDSEVTNLAEVKAFDSTDYATAAQGTLAASATQPSDNISTLTNDSAFIASAGAPVQSVAGRTGTVTVDAGDLTDGDFGGTAILGFDATLNDQTGTAYTIVAGDAGKVLTCNNGSAVTVTVPASLGAGFTCSVVQKGAGQVTFAASSTTINNRQSHTKIAGQHGVATLVSTAADVFVLAGDTAS